LTGYIAEGEGEWWESEVIYNLGVAEEDVKGGGESRAWVINRLGLMK